MQNSYGVKPYSQPYKSDGTRPLIGSDGLATLVVSGTYYFPLGGKEATCESVHAHWPGALVITSAVIEDSDMAETDATYYSSTLGHWIPQNPSAAIVPVVGTGVTATAATVAATGDAGGGAALWNLSGDGSLRKRLKVVVGATGGTMLVAQNGKS